MPAAMHLDLFGKMVRAAFGSMPYQVGSSTTKKDGWRDVDIRLILSDEDYAKLDIGEPGDNSSNPRWMALCMAFSALGKQMTGLPIDFQIQQRTRANAFYGKQKEDGTERIPCGMLPLGFGVIPKNPDDEE
jgi:hypothetical protein